MSRFGIFLSHDWTPTISGNAFTVSDFKGIGKTAFLARFIQSEIESRLVFAEERALRQTQEKFVVDGSCRLSSFSLMDSELLSKSLSLRSWDDIEAQIIAKKRAQSDVKQVAYLLHCLMGATAFTRHEEFDFCALDSSDDLSKSEAEIAYLERILKECSVEPYFATKLMRMSARRFLIRVLGLSFINDEQASLLERAEKEKFSASKISIRNASHENKNRKSIARSAWNDIQIGFKRVPTTKYRTIVRTSDVGREGFSCLIIGRSCSSFQARYQKRKSEMLYSGLAA